MGKNGTLNDLRENKYFQEANWRLHLVFELSGVLQKHWEYFQDSLHKMGIKLAGEEKWHINEMLKASSRAQYHAEQLYLQVTKEKDGTRASYIHESWVELMYAVFLKILEVAGDDDLSKLRFMAIYDELKEKPQLLKAPEMATSELSAFGYIRQLIEEGKVKYEKEQLFQSSLDRVETPEDKD